jgi:hypothetical protein
LETIKKEEHTQLTIEVVIQIYVGGG